MDGGGRDIRRSVTISDHPAGNPDNFPDLNKVREEDDTVAARALNHRSLTLGSGVKRDAFAARAGAGSSSSRALIDEHAVVSRGSDFKDRMRLRTPTGSGDDHIPAATGALPTSPVFGRSLTTRGLPRSASGRDRAVSPEVEVEEEAAAEEEQQPVMSLMALLGGMDEDEEEDDEEEDEEEEEVEAAEEEEHVCCVCMVRHKGPAFVPCAHSFCRLCSREMWVSKGNCPLCNGYILEILDIF